MMLKNYKLEQLLQKLEERDDKKKLEDRMVQRLDLKLEIKNRSSIWVENKTLYANYKGKEYFLKLPEDGIIDWNKANYSKKLASFKSNDILTSDFKISLHKYIDDICTNIMRDQMPYIV